MIVGLETYSQYQQTELRWLPLIPAHWDLRRNGRLFGARKETGYPHLPVLEVSIASGVRVRDLIAGGRKQEMADRSKYQRAAQGDIAYNMMRMWQGAVGVAPTDGLVSPAYVVAQPHPRVETRYFAYLFRTADYMRQVELYSRGIVPDRNRLYWESFKQIFSPVPPEEEQRLIVRFLDAHGALTARLIRAKQRLIKLLEEQKQAIIHRAVTRGLEPNVRLKPSGVPWLSDIPAHWEVKRLKVAFKKILGGSTPASNEPGYWDGDIVWITPVDVGADSELFTSRRKITLAGLQNCAATVVPEGSLVVTSRAPVGNVAIARVPLATNQGCKALVPDINELNPEFAFNLLLVLKGELQSRATGTTFTEISTSRFGDVPIPLPPKDEQLRILSSLTHEIADLRLGIETVRKGIAVLGEFRARLIADVVTGKLDVRAAAAALPEITESEPIGEPTDGVDLEEALDDIEDEVVAA